MSSHLDKYHGRTRLQSFIEKTFQVKKTLIIKVGAALIYGSLEP